MDNITQYEALQIQLNRMRSLLEEERKNNQITKDFIDGKPPKVGYKYVKLESGKYTLEPDMVYHNERLHSLKDQLANGEISGKEFTQLAEKIAVHTIDDLFTKCYFGQIHDLVPNGTKITNFGEE